MKYRRPASLIVSLSVIVSLAQPVRAVDLRNILNGYSLTSWGTNDGLPSSEVLAITQDQDGFLWLGTDSGLVRFDGTRFTPQTGPSVGRSVRALLFSTSGDLWAGLGEDGGVLQYQRTGPGTLMLVREHVSAAAPVGTGPVDGPGLGSVRAIVQEADGSLWVGHLGGLFRFASGQWTRWQAEGLQVTEVHSLATDRRGRLLVGTRRGVFVSNDVGRHTFEALDADPARDDTVPGISVDTDGVVWRADGVHGFQALVGERQPIVPKEIARGNRLLHDRAGHLWVGTGGQGLWRVSTRPGGRVIVEQTTVITGLLGNGVVSVFEDRDGNIWAGTLDGLNRLTRYVATPIQSLGLVSGIEVTPQGIWVMTSSSLLLFPPDGSLDEPVVQHDTAVNTIHGDEAGRLWMSTGDRLWWFDGSGRHEAALGGTGLHDIRLLASNRRGGLWIYDAQRGLYLRTHDGLAPAAVPGDVQRAPMVWMDTTESGTLWLATTDGRLIRVEPGGETSEFGPSSGLDVGVLRAWHIDAAGTLWLGGTDGLARFRDGRFSVVKETHGHRFEGLTAIIEDGDGHLWTAMRSGLLRVAAEDLQRHLEAPADPVPLAYLNKRDGLAGNPRWYGQRGAIRDWQNRLWFVTSRGLSVVAPGRIAPARAVEASVDTVVVDGRSVTDLAGATLAAGTRRLDIQFAALSLGSPATIRFRYRLDGFDAGWVDAGTRRYASYTNLPPGAYTFHVMATNTDGTWPARAAAWSFGVEPMLYQTHWFLVACTLLVLGSVTMGWRLHLRRLRAEMAILFAERARLAREIHDTLLQGLFGVALRCDAIAADVEHDAPRVSTQFMEIRRSVEDYVMEARQSILGLRSPALQRLGLAAALRATGEHLTSGTPVSFSFESKGQRQRCHSDAEEHLLRIGREAITNAVRHAHATSVQAELHYGGDGILLQISDDGRGVDEAAAEHTNGLGLASMRERARAAGGAVAVYSRAGLGTRVEVRVPYGSTDAAA
ncbi:MAG: hypothetical protein IT180_17375 [Acidobacteria bacterium]|nr:hypothetical protein [Acidobacteriota bacterium]